MRLPGQVSTASLFQFLAIQVIVQSSGLVPKRRNPTVKYLARVGVNKLIQINSIVVIQTRGRDHVVSEAQPTHTHPQRPVDVIAVSVPAHATTRPEFQGKGTAHVAGEALLKRKRRCEVCVPFDGASVNRETCQPALEEIKARVSRVVYFGLAERGPVDVLLVQCQPENVVVSQDRIEVFVDHLQENQGSGVRFQVGYHDFPRKVGYCTRAGLLAPRPGMSSGALGGAQGHEWHDWHNG